MFGGHAWILAIAILIYFIGFGMAVKGLMDLNMKLIVPGWITKIFAVGMMIIFAIKAW